MKDASPNYKKQSPKTPGGISKNLLTPCRRVGLSRKWKKSGCSPFISPLSAHNATPEKTDVKGQMKRKKCDENQDVKEQLNSLQGSILCSPMSCYNSNENNEIILTPCRNIEIPRKKSKVLKLSLKTNPETENDLVNDKHLPCNELHRVDKSKTNEINVDDICVSSGRLKSTPVTEVLSMNMTPESNMLKVFRTKSKSKNLSLKKSLSKSECDLKLSNLIDSSSNSKPNDSNPNNLTKECIVVIQNNILNSVPHITRTLTQKTLQQSHSERDVYLSPVNRGIIENVMLNTLDDDDFINKQAQRKLRNLTTKKRNIPLLALESSDTSQSSIEDITKKTILVKKTYEKVVEPQKAKSTGSITQKDIDDLKGQIELKKKLFLAKATSTETEELRGMVKRWQKGCQDAIMELLDLIKNRLPDRQNMGYAEILQTLKIPAELIGYNTENDCFITPDDTNVLLSAFKI